MERIDWFLSLWCLGRGQFLGKRGMCHCGPIENDATSETPDQANNIETEPFHFQLHRILHGSCGDITAITAVGLSVYCGLWYSMERDSKNCHTAFSFSRTLSAALGKVGSISRLSIFTNIAISLSSLKVCNYWGSVIYNWTTSHSPYSRHLPNRNLQLTNSSTSWSIVGTWAMPRRLSQATNHKGNEAEIF